MSNNKRLELIEEEIKEKETKGEEIDIDKYLEDIVDEVTNVFIYDRIPGECKYIRKCMRAKHYCTCDYCINEFAGEIIYRGR